VVVGSRVVGQPVPVSSCYLWATLWPEEGSSYSPVVVDADYTLSPPKNAVRGKEPHPTRGIPVAHNTADLKD